MIHDCHFLSESRARVKLCKEHFAKATKCVDDDLAGAGLGPDQIHEVLLVGGSSRIPRIKQLIKEKFGGGEPNETLNADEAVAIGAAIQATIMSDSAPPELSDTILNDVTPLTLGIRLADGRFSKMIKRNSKIPTKASRHYSNPVDYGDAIMIRIFEGEREDALQNHFLGRIELRGITKAPAGTISILVTFAIDHNSILQVSAIEEGSQQQSSITIENHERHSQDEIERMIADAETYKAADRAALALARAKNDLSTFANMLLNWLQGGPAIDAAKNIQLTAAVSRTTRWLENTPNITHQMCVAEHGALKAAAEKIVSEASSHRLTGGMKGLNDDQDCRCGSVAAAWLITKRLKLLQGCGGRLTGFNGCATLDS